MRSQRALPALETPDTLPPSEMAVHGSQIDILVPNEPESGFVENALDHTIDDQLEDQHHEDEIVEHLEVIGVFAILRGAWLLMLL